jgi:hypothetical protein
VTRTLTAIAAALALSSLPALAQPTNLRPTKDVTVTYRMTGVANMPPQELQMAFAPALGKQRVDPPGGMGWMLIDRKANSAVMVMDAQRMTMAMPQDTVTAMTQETPSGATFSRKGTATVAGVSCTEWNVALGDNKGTSCITDDGLLLRSDAKAPNGATMTMEATKVSYGPVDPARLAVPSGYSAVQMPSGAPAAPGTPPSR